MDTLAFYFAALSLGLLGGSHCAGMCGPILWALPFQKGKGYAFLSTAGIYHLGRISTYALMGFFFFMLGQGLSLGPFQSYLSIFAGLFIILVYAVPALGIKKYVESPLYRFHSWLRRVFQPYLHFKSKMNILLLGGVNGFLPCGLVYLALSTSLGLEYSYQAVLIMVFFGLGTLPWLVGISWLQKIVSIGKVARFRWVLPVFSLFLGLWLLFRGFGVQMEIREMAQVDSQSFDHIIICR